MNKSDLRNQILEKRKNIKDKEKKSTIIVDKILHLDIYKNSKVIAIYNSLPNEVDTSYLINKSIDKEILLPRITNNKMVFIKVNSNTKYTKSNFNINEPIGEEYLGKIDLIIVPGVAFDKYLSRLGYGKGYYDKYLENKNVYKIGICFSEQIVDKVPIDKHDIKMNLLLTEKEFIKLF